MIIRFILVLILVISSLCKQANTSNRFPHKMWIYWNDPNLTNAPLFTQLCINNIRHYAEVSGWELVIINNDNIGSYITQESNKKLQFLKQRITLLTKKEPTPQALSDLYRTFLLHDNGGMWSDIIIAYLRDFSWVQNLEQFELIQNSIAKQPEILMHTNDLYFGGNKTVIFDEKKQKDLYLFPGLEFWSVIAKPRTKFFRDVIGELINTLSQQSLDNIVEEKKKQGYLYLLQSSRYFIYSTFHFQNLLQGKQREIDSHLDNFSVKYAVEHYGIWTINSIDNGLSLFYYYYWWKEPTNHLIFYQPFSAFPQSIKKSVFFKFNVKDFMQILNDGLTSDCSIKQGAFKNNSFVSQYLLKHSENLPFVKKIRSLERNGWNKAQCTNQKAGYDVKYLLCIIAMTFILSIICFAKCLERLGAAIDKRITNSMEQSEAIEQ